MSFIISLLIVAGIYFIEPLEAYAPLIGLILGVILAGTKIVKPPENLKKLRKTVLNTAIVFLGFSLNFRDVITVGSKGVLVSLTSIVLVVAVGYLLIKLFKLDEKTGELTVFGTAICGGSAITATSAIIKPKEHQFAIAISTVFILNAVGLIIFPPIGHLLSLTNEQFGVFSALAIHDVSSVVGAAAAYSDESLKIATILKLTRTLWIIPIIFLLSFKYNDKDDRKNILKLFPIFIILFILASVFATAVDNEFVTSLGKVGKFGLAIALFLVGLGINIDDIKEIGPKGLGFAITLWIFSIAVALTLALNVSISV